MGFKRIVAHWWAAGVVIALGVAAALDITGRLTLMYRWLHEHVSPEGWSALGTWATAAIAFGAAAFALFQVREARRTREELAQPNVALYAELNHTDWQVIEIVVKNFGSTPAYHITFDFQHRPLKRCPTMGGDVVDVYFPDEIPYLAPGQEWRTVWDDSEARRKYKAGADNFFGDPAFYPDGVPREKLLIDRHDVDVNFEDARKKKLPTVPCVIDFKILDETSRLRVKTMDDLVNTITEHTQVQTALFGLATGQIKAANGN
ncbi:hypothetical protein [Mycolicibacterium sp. J2]|uniref:hypothetical protein n=1 Tax=Mycolicibacterium sp. J2 TaxID=2993511 RepID=UPI00224B4010|nr:hypothetical protein [Mycolicibacterium sp. J2]MCX2714223.1 hypothetical protein [Mycolicibacterium sp. J2]